MSSKRNSILLKHIFAEGYNCYSFKFPAKTTRRNIDLSLNLNLPMIYDIIATDIGHIKQYSYQVPKI